MFIISRSIERKSSIKKMYGTVESVIVQRIKCDLFKFEYKFGDKSLQKCKTFIFDKKKLN